MPLAQNLVYTGKVAYDRTGDKGQVPWNKYNAAITELYGKTATIGATFTFTQSAAVAFWQITHNLGAFPSITVVDSTGREVDGDTQYLDANRLTIQFSAPFSGLAYLN